MYKQSNRIKVKKIKTILTIIVISFSLGGCYLNDYRNIEKIQIDSFNPTYGFPIINSSITITDLLSAADSTTIIAVRNDSIFLVFNQEMDFDLDLNDFKVPDISFSGTLELPSPGIAFEGYHKDYKNFTTIENDSEIRSIDLKNGTLTVKFERDVIDNDLEVTIILQSLTTSASPDSTVITSKWAPNALTHTITMNLAGAKLLLQAPDETTGIPLYNMFTWATRIKSKGQKEVQLKNTISFSSLEFEKVTGLIHYEVPIPTQTLDLAAFNSIKEGEFNLSNPNVALILGTSFGIPSSAQISNFTFKNSKKQTRELKNEGVLSDNALRVGVGNKNYIPAASSTIPYVQRRLLINKNNSNIKDVLSFLPVEVMLNGKFLLGDYNGTVADPHSFFVNHGSSFDMDMNIEVPLAGSIKNLIFEKDIDNIEWPKLDSIKMLSNYDYNIDMLMKTTNEIPLTFGLQVFFIENEVVIDSLYNNVMVENIVQSPRVDNLGLPIGNTEKTSVVTMDRKKYERVSKASQMRLKFDLETATEAQRDVLFKASQKLNVQMAVKLHLMVPPNN